MANVAGQDSLSERSNKTVLHELREVMNGPQTIESLSANQNLLIEILIEKQRTTEELVKSWLLMVKKVERLFEITKNQKRYVRGLMNETSAVTRHILEMKTLVHETKTMIRELQDRNILDPIAEAAEDVSDAQSGDNN